MKRPRGIEKELMDWANDPFSSANEPTSTIELARLACVTEQGKMALYYLAGEIMNLSSYGLIAKDRTNPMVSRKEVLAKIEELQKHPRAAREPKEGDR